MNNYSLNPIIEDDEYLYRGIIDLNWDYENNRPSSATFKDSRGVSVDREGGRREESCISALSTKKDFFAICKVITRKVRELNALVKYVPIEDNQYHSEIHDSEERIQLRGSKPKKIRDNAIIIFKK